MMSNRIAILNSVIIILGAPLLLMWWFAPFDFFIDIEYVHHQDTCAEQPMQTLVTLREVKWKDEYHGTIREELYRYEDGIKLETTINRVTPVIYQKSDKPLTIEIEWNKNLPAGNYGVYTVAEIDAGFAKRDIRLEDTQKFRVVNCDRYAI